jgi:hypothetical protein
VPVAAETAQATTLPPAAGCARDVVGEPAEPGTADSAVSLAELSAGVHSAAGPVERARRIVRVRRVEATFSAAPSQPDHKTTS